MKRISMKSVSLALVLVLLVASAMPAFAKKKNYPDGAYRVVVDEPGMRLNVHETPKGGRDNVIDRLDEGTVVIYQYSEKGWWNVQWWHDHDDLRTGYVDSSFLIKVDADPTIRYTCVDNSYIHSQPDIAESECALYHIDKLMVGTEAYIIEQRRSWSLLAYEGKTGWIASQYLIQAK